jgi:hypothetical protein
MHAHGRNQSITPQDRLHQGAHALVDPINADQLDSTIRGSSLHPPRSAQAAPANIKGPFLRASPRQLSPCSGR